MKLCKLKITIIILFLAALGLGSCRKENARNKYFFRLEFDSGDIWEKECYLFEKHKRNKRYRNSGVEDAVDLKHSKGLIYTDALKGETVLYKVEGHLIGVSNVNIKVSNFSILNSQSGLMQGNIELEGEYQQSGKAYKVENGTFKFQLRGALYNLQDSVFTGKWILKRK